MIQVNELRIGNYVMTGNIKSIVLEIFASGITHDSKNGNIVAGHCGWSHINPIQLTEEWLLKFGFISNPYADRYELGSFYIEHNAERGYSIFWFDKTGTTLEYVHQLQNLYHALTGEELKIQQ